MKRLLVFVFFWSGMLTVGAQGLQQTPPVFPNCKSVNEAEAQACFDQEVQRFVYQNFKAKTNYQGAVIVVFEVDQSGKFKPLYIDAADAEVTAECRRVFEKFPVIQPAVYGGKATYSKYTIRFNVPLQNPDDAPKSLTKQQQAPVVPTTFQKETRVMELDTMQYQTFTKPQYDSKLAIPFSNRLYASFDWAMNQVGANAHTTSKPFTFNEVSKYYNLREAHQQLMKPKSSWWGKKIWNDDLVAIQGNDYRFTLNPVFDFQLGRETSGATDYTFVNTRGVQIRGGLGKEVNFSATIYESQGRFADYFNQYAISLRPSGGNPATIPGIGIAKEFKTDAFDFPMAEAYINYAPGKFVEMQLGHGRNFIGDGYRSLLLTDGVSPYPYFKINTTFWKIKYTNLYMWMKDNRPEVTVDGTYATKFVASHYLSWNVNRRLNIGFFESVVWANQNDRGFDMNFVNPIIFYRAVEFSSSSRSGNALLGLTGKYKLSNSVNAYGQFLLDEFSLGEIRAQNQSWKNKYAYQLGLKYYNAFNVDNLMLQLEYNFVRPYVYSHSNVLTNYGNSNQSLGHQWGGNLKELIAIGRYTHGRYYASAKLHYGVRGLDINGLNYGGNIYLSYNDFRPTDTGVVVGQGNETMVFIADLQAGYVINPTTNLKLFANVIFRNFDPTTVTDTVKSSNTTWFSIGVRTDIFNWYFDY
ncbi:MAG: gliding motility protein RemB [Flavobacterium sp.]|uniref:gliding motility protein RemB n=1 Tax=Flavobacterium sp. TaxID=239 RepID=UPI0022C532F3|nr:gliding motility protein RemB [Flavobacterium sp.]MCZ8297584.1 gliding motility protein RemB [Flavobacterium sp.]